MKSGNGKRWSLVLMSALLLLRSAPAASAASCAPPRPPKFVLLLCDNLGYGDVAPFGSTLHRTPNLDRMARERPAAESRARK